jgi:hypothetical protein
MTAPLLIIRCEHGDGHAPAVAGDPRHIRAHKRRQRFAVRFAAHAGSVATLEGEVRMQAGDAVVTGLDGEQWPVARARFQASYAPVAPLGFGQDGLYESLPLPVLALPLEQACEVQLPDGVSRLHGQPGDWLVDYGDGSLGVVAAALFERVYAREPQI